MEVKMYQINRSLFMVIMWVQQIFQITVTA